MSDDRALKVLRGIMTRLRSQRWERDHFDIALARSAREDALTRFATILSPERVEGVDGETLSELLGELKKRQGIGQGRGVPKSADLDQLKEAVGILVDERLSLTDRLDRLRPPGGAAMVKGLGPSVITAILHLIAPDRYGIMSGTVESVLRLLDVYPELPRSASLAMKYEAVNGVLLRLASALGIELGVLDYLFWRVQTQDHADFAAPPTRPR